MDEFPDRAAIGVGCFCPIAGQGVKILSQIVEAVGEPREYRAGRFEADLRLGLFTRTAVAWETAGWSEIQCWAGLDWAMHDLIAPLPAGF